MMLATGTVRACVRGRNRAEVAGLDMVGEQRSRERRWVGAEGGEGVGAGKEGVGLRDRWLGEGRVWALHRASKLFTLHYITSMRAEDQASAWLEVQIHSLAPKHQESKRCLSGAHV